MGRRKRAERRTKGTYREPGSSDGGSDSVGSSRAGSEDGRESSGRRGRRERLSGEGSGGRHGKGGDGEKATSASSHLDRGLDRFDFRARRPRPGQIAAPQPRVARQVGFLARTNPTSRFYACRAASKNTTPAHKLEQKLFLDEITELISWIRRRAGEEQPAISNARPRSGIARTSRPN